MGEKIKNIGYIKIPKNKIEMAIELNKGYSSGFDIHIQNNFFQYNFLGSDFLTFAQMLILAKNKLCKEKNISNE